MKMSCNFLFVNGDKIGTYCGENSVFIEGNKRRCLACCHRSWAPVTYICKYIITRGIRSGTECGKSTRFSDCFCSVHRKKDISIDNLKLTSEITQSTCIPL